MSSESFQAEPSTALDEQSVGLLGSNMEARAEFQKTRHYRSLYSFTTSLGIGLIILVLFWIMHYHSGFSWSSNPSVQFNWHPLLMVLGMVFLYSQSMLIYRTFRDSPKKKLKLIHAALHLLAFILSVIGLKAVFDSHNLAKVPIPNLYTLHSWVGLATIIIFSAQFLLGFLSFLYPGLSNTLRKVVLPVHVKFGVGCFILAIVTTMTGIMEKAVWNMGSNYQDLPSEGIIMNFLGIFTVLYGVMVLYLVNELDYKRVAVSDDEIRLATSE